MRAAVVGHVEWVEFLRVDRLPAPGEIVHATAGWEGPGGAGSGAAVQLHKLAGDCTFFTALGDDGFGRRAALQLEELGLLVEVAVRSGPTRRALTHIDAAGERTITVIGERHAPYGRDELSWDELDDVDVVYFTAGDVAALRMARRARVLVATSRVLSLLRGSGVELDALVGSAVDPAETYRDGDLDPAPRLVVRTAGAKGGTFAPRGRPLASFPATTVPGEIVDRYGAGDSFAAALGFAIADGRDLEDALDVAARCGAAVLTGRGPYEGQLSRADL